MEQQSKFFKLRISVIIAALIIFAAIFYCVVTANAAWLDDPVREFFYSLRNDALTPVIIAITYLGNWQTIVLFCILLLVAGATRLTYGLPISIGALIVTIVNKSIKHLVGRPRPEDVVHLINEGGFSFTSGHSITSMFFYGMLIYLIRRNVKNRRLANALTVFLSIPMILVGLSRIYLGVHYPTDVLGGWCLGIIAITAGAMIIQHIDMKNKEELS